MNDTELSSPKELNATLESLAAFLTAQEALHVYQLADPSEKRLIGPLVRHKIGQTSAEDWSESDRRQIAEWFGIHLLPGPGPLDESAAEDGRVTRR